MLRKVLSITMAAILSLSAFCGCGEEESSTENFYGQIMKEVDGKEIYLIYDGRYLADEEMDAVVDYYCSIQDCDTERFCSTQPEVYISYLEEKQSADMSSFVSGEHDSIASALGEGFDFTQIEVTDYGTAKEDNGINDIKELLDGIYTELGKEPVFSETVKDTKYINFDISATGADGDTYNLTDEMLYIFNCEDGIYIF